MVYCRLYLSVCYVSYMIKVKLVEQVKGLELRVDKLELRCYCLDDLKF